MLFVTLNKKTHTVSAHCALSIEHSECTQHSVLSPRAADLPVSLGLGESLRVSPSLSESHLGLEHPGRDFGPRASVGIAPIT